MERTKTCKKCKELKPAEMFNTDNRTMDKLTALCIDCKRTRREELKEARKPNKSREDNKVIKQQKLLKIARKVTEGLTPAEAYHSLGTTKTRATASAANTRFMKTLDDDDLSLFRKMLTPPPILQGIQDFFTDVLTRTVSSTIDEYNKTLHSWCKLAGTYAPEKTETTTMTMTKEASMTTLQEVAKMLKQEKEAEDAV